MERLDEIVRGSQLAIVQRVFHAAHEFRFQAVILVEIVRELAAAAFIGRIDQRGVACVGHR